MARRKAPVKENHERWLVSYADLVTLLFAFFVVMFASTQSDHGRAKQISQAVEKALKSGTTPPKLAAILGGTVNDTGRGSDAMRGPAVRLPPLPKSDDDTPKDLETTVSLLHDRLADAIKSGDIEIRVEQRGVILGLSSAVFFALGDDAIPPRVYPTLDRVAAILNGLPNALRLEGHTDSLPINNSRFKDNWELSAARSIAMLRLLNERYGVARDRMAIVGYADTAALDSNDTEQGRGRNRRVDIVIVSAAGLKAEARPHSPASFSPSARP